MLFSDPNEFQSYEPEFSAPVHVDMKRWAEKGPELKGQELEGLEIEAPKKANSTDHRPLFEKYQFFTPGESYFWRASGAMFADSGNSDLHDLHRPNYRPFHPRRWPQGAR